MWWWLKIVTRMYAIYIQTHTKNSLINEMVFSSQTKWFTLLCYQRAATFYLKVVSEQCFSFIESLILWLGWTKITVLKWSGQTIFYLLHFMFYVALIKIIRTRKTFCLSGLWYKILQLTCAHLKYDEKERRSLKKKPFIFSVFIIKSVFVQPLLISSQLVFHNISN